MYYTQLHHKFKRGTENEKQEEREDSSQSNEWRLELVSRTHIPVPSGRTVIPSGQCHRQGSGQHWSCFSPPFFTERKADLRFPISIRWYCTFRQSLWFGVFSKTLASTGRNFEPELVPPEAIARFFKARVGRFVKF